MNRTKRTLLIFSISLFLITLAFPAFSDSHKRGGSSYRNNVIEIYNIQSKRLEKKSSGLIYYSFRAKVRNRINQPVTVTVTFQAVDRNGYELEDVLFHNKLIKSNSARTLTDRLVMDARDYKHIWEWKIEELRMK